ncbi:hybrid sensor histidine kinase/response regulator [Sorangium sp. So ce1097]|uniref:hybrid sensor histidine kinase/response regulator n=1 Tax=Sorangium sp. So ce1097 TaxID=3133330 RepID=UPI003F642F2F
MQSLDGQPISAGSVSERGAPRPERVVARLQRLQAITAALAGARTLAEIAGTIIDQGMPALDAEVGVVALLSSDGATLRNLGFKGVPVETEEDWGEVPVDSPVPVAEAARLGAPVVVPTREERNARYPLLAGVHGVERGGAVVAFPLVVESRTVGSLGFCFPASRPFDADDHAFVLSMAQQCALAIERVRWHEVAEQEIAHRRASESALRARELELIALVAELRQTQDALREADRRKDEFLAMLAHELRNPLAPLLSAVELLEAAGPATPVVERARTIMDRQIGHMTRLVDDLLDISRVSRGKIALSAERLDVVELARAAALDYRPLIEARGVRFELALPAEPVWLRADATRLAQAIGNLLQNACKFTDDGGSVRLSVAPDRGRGVVCVEVADTGIGMDPAILERIFEPFTQADRTRARSRGGLGLGLALVKGVVELHGGTVRAASAGVGQGAAIAITLPLDAAAPRPRGAADQRHPATAASAADQRRPATAASAGSARRILIIEDNLDAADSLRMLLERRGHAVCVAHSGADGVAAARTAPPDVILCDIGLPGDMSGYCVARALRGDSALRATRMVALTGYGQDDDRRLAHAAGFDAHLTKPVTQAMLERLLAELASPPGSARGARG